MSKGRLNLWLGSLKGLFELGLNQSNAVLTIEYIALNKASDRARYPAFDSFLLSTVNWALNYSFVSFQLVK